MRSEIARLDAEALAANSAAQIALAKQALAGYRPAVAHEESADELRRAEVLDAALDDLAEGERRLLALGRDRQSSICSVDAEASRMPLIQHFLYQWLGVASEQTLPRQSR